MDSHVYDTLILSDLHLGADMSRARDALRILRQLRYRRLILNGDIFADFAMASVAHLGTADLGLEHAKMVAYKAIADAIEVAAVYVGPPIQMYVVTGAGHIR